MENWKQFLDDCETLLSAEKKTTVTTATTS